MLLLAASPLISSAQTINFSQMPLFLGTSVKPNVLVIYDNSQSMDGTMAGKLIAGNDATTRGNIARSVLRNTITANRNTFQWGLASFGLADNGLYTTYAYYLGDDAGLVYTNNCNNGISAPNGNRRCIANPDPANGFNFITYDLTGDDPSVNDVLYTGDFGAGGYAIGVNGTTNYDVWAGRQANTGWDAGNFTNKIGGTWAFTPTDAGFLPSTPPYRRQLYVRRAWGYMGNITGTGALNRAVQADSTGHFNALMSLLAVETNDIATGELKNAAVYTPLAGTLGTASSYFGNTLAGNGTPISQSCQRNFVLLATDGNPTGRTNGSMYSLAEQANTYNAATSTWTFSTAANDVFTQITGLRSVSYNAKTYDVQTYVVGLGDSVANASSVATLNRMAQLGGTDAAYLASDESALALAFQRIAVDIISKTAAASAVSLNSGSWNTGSKVYQGRFSSGDWSGQLLSFAVADTGQPSSTADWDAGQVLKTQNWNSGRNIITYKGSNALGARGVAFRWPNNTANLGANDIDAAMVTALNKDIVGATDNFGSQRLEYLRGNTARELANCTACTAPVFRNRPTSPLGDIVGSAPAYVGSATGDFRDTIETVAYSTYAKNRASQTPAIFVGANDGMLHAFNANTGAELFAYVPSMVRDRLSAITHQSYSHQYTVDGSPAVADVFYGGAWHTALVSGLSAGAKGLFALDVTTPANFVENKADKVARWEIDGTDADMGHVFGRPILAKMRDGKWRAIVGNGYNSTNGKAVLYLIDVETGGVTKISTQSGASGTPNGLSGVAVVSTADDGVADLVYAGDLYGNLWKFDVSSSTSTSWAVAFTAASLPAPLFQASGQQITARPDVAKHPQGGYMVTFGTGRYLDSADNATTGTQTVYGIWDKGLTVTATDLQSQTIVSTATGTDSKTYRLSTHAVGSPPDTSITGDNVITLANYFSTKKGWKINLVDTGERVISEATVRYGRVVIATLIPSTAACSYGGDGWILDLDAITGNRSPALDTNADNTVNTSDYINGTMASGVKVGSIPAAPSIMRSKTRTLDDKLINTSSGSIVRVRESGNLTPSRRAAWEQIR